ncbi:unnamed protein product [Orchesella dallaii]|uniref:Uncharacterized protein n=1 Tax=Orchesella dallaii TaxID=48710 RepID=A0ABP1RRK9_9HEXA
MESYVTRREFENVLKEVRRLQFFLADTFGPKFMEFFKDDKFLEAESQLNSELGSFVTNVLNASLKMGVPPPPPPPQSQPVRLSSAVGGVPPPPQSQTVRLSSAAGGVPPPSSLVVSLPPPTPALPGAKTPISNYNFSIDYGKSVSENQSAPSARLLITEVLHARDRLRLKGYKNQDKILDAAMAKLSSVTPSASQPTPSSVSPVVPISVVREVINEK